MPDWSIHTGDCLTVLPSLPSGEVQSCVTSPPYWSLRNYGDVRDQIGSESSVSEWCAKLVRVFDAVRRVMREDGTLWVVVGDAHAANVSGSVVGSTLTKGGRQTLHSRQGRRGSFEVPKKNLLGMPWRLAFALQDAGWILRQDIVWEKPNVMPDGARDRHTGAHEYVFMFAASPRYAWSRSGASESAVDGMRNGRSVWRIPTQASRSGHSAVFPEELARKCLRPSCPNGGLVLDPFSGSGTTGVAALGLGLDYIGIDSDPATNRTARQRLRRITS